MSLKKQDDKSDERLERRIRPETKVEWLWGQIVQKQREIRLLENELARTEHDELVEESDPTIPR